MKIMAILRYKNSIRLTGIDAESYYRDTGRNSLPKSVDEYNQAMRETKARWLFIDSPEARLLLATCFTELDLM
jgi:hypothetical protein